MREIKFRAWEEKGKDMIYSHRGNFVMELDGECSFVEWGHNYFKPMPDLILMQFTGLKDKDGKEIYEGDILFWKDKNDPESTSMFSIIFNEGCFCDDDDEPLFELISKNDILGDYEVIGNIYENPEILEHDTLHESKDDNNVSSDGVEKC